MPNVALGRLRPTPSMGVALVALFIALGGPAQARRLIDGHSIRKGTITGRQIKNRSLGQGELTRATVRALRGTPAAGVRSAQLANGAVTAPKLGAGAVTGAAIADGSVGAADLAAGAVWAGQLAPGAVTASKIADNSVGGTTVADGTLQTVDVGTFAGALQVDFAPFYMDSCQFTEVPATPTGAGQPNIGDDVVVVSPEAGWPDQLVVTAKPGPGNMVRVAACNPTSQTIDPGDTVFRYVSFDSP